MQNLQITMQERYLAIVLLDIIGSTKFVQRQGAVKAARLFQYHDQLARSLCYKHQGREIDRSDGFLLSFETLVDAVAFALAYQKEVPSKTRLQCRIGIHWGKIIEVLQSEKYVGAGAKRVELEGLAKNIAARTMSLCQAGQVLITKEAKDHLSSRLTTKLPKDARIVCVGLYKFKGVSESQEIYAVGTTIESLQPPEGSEKVKRLGGPKYIKERARDRKFWGWVEYIFWRIGFIVILVWAYILFQISLTPMGRTYIGLPYYMPRYDATIELIVGVWREVTDDPKKKKPRKRKRKVKKRPRRLRRYHE